MKKLTKEEVEKLVVRKGKSTPVRTGVMHLQPGEFLLIEKSDWNQQNGPGQMLSRLAKKTGMEFKLQTVDSGNGGWIVERLK